MIGTGSSGPKSEAHSDVLGHSIENVVFFSMRSLRAKIKEKTKLNLLKTFFLDIFMYGESDGKLFFS